MENSNISQLYIYIKINAASVSIRDWF